MAHPPTLGCDIEGKPVDPRKIIEDLYCDAMDHGDWKDVGNHGLEISFGVYYTLMKDSDWWDYNCHKDKEGNWLYRGMFKIMIIHESVPEMSYKAMTHTVPDFQHMSIHLERTNGRMRYHDWDGNSDQTK